MIRHSRGQWGVKASAVALALAVVSSVLSACTNQVSAPSTQGVLATFASAWSETDAFAMVDVFDADTKQAWPADDLQEFLDETLDDGAIESVEVDPDPVVPPEVESEEELEGLETTTSYTVTYTSEAAAEPVDLEGRLELTLTGERWTIAWDDNKMWPGIEGAAGFAVNVEEPTRGAIVDRNGKVLAKGAADSRRYPQGSVAGSTIGHLEPVAKKKATAGLKPGDLVGASGLEAGLEEELTAASGGELFVVDSAGEQLELLGSQPSGRPERVKTTLDVNIQRAAENAFGSTTGGAVVMDPATGDLLAVVSSSRFNPNNYVGVEGVAPFNRALSGTYPPGSSMKVVTASAALDTKTVTPESTVTGPKEYKGVHNFESGEFGSISFSTATQNSVNTAFAQVAEELGADTMFDYAERFGFNQKPDMPLDAATPSYPYPETLTDLMWSSIGQAQVIATPLQMATIAATVANKGVRMEPRIVLDDESTGERVMSRRSARQMTELMELVVTGGTGVAADLGAPTVAGKTGTAEVSVDGKIENHAWFICFAPSNDPEVAVAVVSEFGGVGGEVAAPLAREILQAVLPLV